MARLHAFGKAFEATWDRERGHRTFAQVAHDALAAADLPPFEWSDVERYATEHGNHSSFGDLNAMAYRCEEFFIEVLVWGDLSPDLHSHSFSGAFRVLEGGSLHASYTTTRTHWASPLAVVADTRLTSLDVLRPGDTVAIEPGPCFMHGLFHFAKPSATIVLRTRRDSNYPYQFGMVPYGASPRVLLAGQQSIEDGKLRAIRHLAKLRPWPRLERLLRSAIGQLEPWRVWALLSEFEGRWSGSMRETLLDALPTPFRAVPLPSPSFGTFRHVRHLLGSDEARLGAGLALFGPDRPTVLDCLARARLAADPEELLASSLSAAFADVLSESEGLSEPIVRAVLRGDDYRSVLHALADGFTETSLADHAAEVRAAYDLAQTEFSRLAAPSCAAPSKGPLDVRHV